jgi:hypothetical protein
VEMLVAQFQWVMLVSGLLTLTMLYAAVAPRAALQATFGETLEGPLAEMIVRNWGALIGLVGAMLVWGAFQPEQRPLILVVAAASKLVFVGLVVSHPPYRRKAMVPVAVDLVMIALFAAYLLAA